MKVGDYATIRDGVHDEKMPSGGRRDCLILEVIGKKRDQVSVMFHNGNVLKFHVSQVQLLQTLCKN